MSNSIQTSIYKLRQEIAVMDSIGKLQKKEIDFSFLESQLKISGYNSQKLKSNFSKTYEFSLFHKQWPNQIKWKDFIEDIVENDQDIIKKNVSINEGFVLFIKKKKGKNIYAITGSFGHTEIQSYIDYQFGLNILSRLITSEAKVIKSAKERNFVGGVLGTVKYFRGEFNLNENESFGNYYQELRTSIDKITLKNVFKFKDDEIKKGGLCDAKSSFTIRKPISLNRAIEIIDALQGLLQKKSSNDLNLIKRLDKSDKALIETLDNEVEKKLFEIFNGRIDDVNFEICHKYFDKYYEANLYQIEFRDKRKTISEDLEECLNFLDVVNLYKNNSVTLSNKEELKSLIDNTRIHSSDGSNVITQGFLYDHLCTEISFNHKSYFLFNQEWYLIKPDFQKILNEQCQDFINQNSLNGLLKKWNSTQSENSFNSSHIGDVDTLVFDKITPENIEVCDILKWDKDKVYFIHIKEGFNNEMRNLGRQVHISARRIVQDLKTGKKFLAELYDVLKNSTGTSSYSIAVKKQLAGINKKDFLLIFDKRELVFVIAVLDSSIVSSRTFSDITKFNSNIAKFCLQQLRQEMRLLDIELKILQIEK